MTEWAKERLSTTATCARCGRQIEGGFVFTGPQGPVRKCLRCALRHRPMLWRSFWTCLVVGTILTLINQGTLFLQGEFPPSLFWKIPLTYFVPFMVATWGALSNTVVRRAR